MCGIVGVIGPNIRSKDSLVSSLQHRGPDSFGSYSEEKVFLGHTRLAILDLSDRGNQPMFSENERYVIVFNGEIYNHLEIRRKYLSEYAFKSTTDTETILYLYIEFGKKFLNILNGIFALAIYDRVNQEIFIARDQIGVKPLYIYKDERQLAFSSELKSFFEIDIQKTLAKEAFSNYLTFLWSPGELTPLKNVTKLLPGHYLNFNVRDLRSATSQKYYQIPFDGCYANSSKNQLIQELDKKLLAAVERQMLSDVPIGFFLSGGLDSSLLVAMAKKIKPDAKLECFTIETSYNEGFEDDLKYAKKVAAYLDVKLHVIKADVNIVRDFDKMVWHLDEPQSDTSPLNVLNICSHARNNGIKVLIGGTGGDDLFSGYRRHQALDLEKYIDFLPGYVRRYFKTVGGKLSSQTPFFRRIKKLLAEVEKERYHRLAGYFGWLSHESVINLFSEEWKGELSSYDPIANLIALNKEIKDENSLLNQILYWEMKSFLVDQNLNYTDKLSMAAGVEVRVPYLDIDLVEFSTKIPPEYKMRGRETKYLLKKVAEQYLPREVIYRTKTGFGAPVRRWITKDLDEMIQDYLSPAQINKRGIFSTDKVWKLIKDNKQGKIDASYTVWSLLAIESWMRQFID